MQKTFKHKVVDCPNCKKEYISPTEQAFIKDTGICLGCDKRYCEVQEDLTQDFDSQYNYA